MLVRLRSTLFIASSPQLLEVTSKLTSLFVTAAECGDTGASSYDYYEYFREQLETAKSKLTDSEEQVRASKMQHLGELCPATGREPGDHGRPAITTSEYDTASINRGGTAGDC